MQDDFDSFVDDSEFIIEQIEKGYDVSDMLEDLKKRARTMDPNTVPTTSFDPILVSTMIEDLLRNGTPSPSINEYHESTATIEHPRSEEINEAGYHSAKTVFRSKSSSECNLIRKTSNSSLTPRSSSSYNIPIKILLTLSIILISLSYYYFLVLPSTCPKPIW